MKFKNHFKNVLDAQAEVKAAVEAVRHSVAEALLASDGLSSLLREEPGLTLLDKIAGATETAFADEGTEASDKAVAYLLEPIEDELTRDVLGSAAALLEHTLEVIQLLYPDISPENADDTVAPEHGAVFFAADLTASLLRDCVAHPLRINMLLLDDTASRLQRELTEMLQKLAGEAAGDGEDA